MIQGRRTSRQTAVLVQPTPQMIPAASSTKRGLAELTVCGLLAIRAISEKVKP